MTKDDFTADAIRYELLDYVVNQDFPADELYEIGSHVYITGISDIEISSVTEDDSHFVVEGTATLEVDTDLSLPGATQHLPRLCRNMFCTSKRLAQGKKR